MTSKKVYNQIIDKLDSIPKGIQITQFDLIKYTAQEGKSSLVSPEKSQTWPTVYKLLLLLVDYWLS